MTHNAYLGEQDELWELADGWDPGEEWELGEAATTTGQRSVISDTQTLVPAGTSWPMTDTRRTPAGGRSSGTAAASVTHRRDGTSRWTTGPRPPSSADWT